MSGELTTPQSINDRIKDKIKETFLDLVPDDQWEAMVKKITDDYFQAHGNNTGSRSPFEVQVNAIIAEHVKFKLQEKIGEYLCHAWDIQGNQLLNDKMKELVVEAAPAMFANMMSNAISRTVQDANNNVY